MKHWGSRDANHASIAADFRGLGCTVADTDSTGIPGWPDLVVGCIGVNHLVEIKSRATAYGRNGLNPDQSAFNRDWRGEPVAVVYETGDVVALVKHWRSVAATPATRRRHLLELLLVVALLAGCASRTPCNKTLGPRDTLSTCTVQRSCKLECTTEASVEEMPKPPETATPPP